MEQLKINAMLLRVLLSIVMLVGTLSFGNAQNIIVEADEPIAQMMDRYVELNKSRTFVQGWRVQILATPDRQRLETVKQSFKYRYPNIPVDWEHVKPYYKLRAGAFESKLEAMRLKYILQQDYSGIYLVKDDKISPSELIGNF
ncbi:MAG: SPOR domain-containing protein [Mameliella sp.]|nr:SPOR domain-containing protein [Phaeodactylibacter sp.]NRA47789.1 SPOR domain-containing protein [Phaeodactylibacter sp.]